MTPYRDAVPIKNIHMIRVFELAERDYVEAPRAQGRQDQPADPTLTLEDVVEVVQALLQEAKPAPRKRTPRSQTT